MVYDVIFNDLYKYIYWNIGSRDDAQDLASEVFVKALAALDRFEAARSTARAWLFTIARNLVVDHHRKRSRRSQAALADDIPSAGCMEDAVETAAASTAVRAALRELNEEQRQVVTMKFFSGLSNAEVAAAMGKREGAVNAMQHRALKKMGKMLEEEGWNRKVCE